MLLLLLQNNFSLERLSEISPLWGFFRGRFLKYILKRQFKIPDFGDFFEENITFLPFP